MKTDINHFGRLNAKYITFILALCWVIACDAPRENPLDPLSSTYITKHAPEAIADLSIVALTSNECLLRWTAPNNAQRYLLFYGNLDWDGSDTTIATKYIGNLPAPTIGSQEWTINVIPSSSYRWSLFSVSKDGVLSLPSNLLNINVPNRDRMASVQFTHRTSHIAWWGIPSQISLELHALINDSDIVHSVWVQDGTDTLFTLSPLNESPTNTIWHAEIFEYQIEDETFQPLIGKTLSLWHSDGEGFTTMDTTFHIVRVIDFAPRTVSPSSDSLATPNPGFFLHWESFNAFYNFTYSIEIFHMSETFVPTRVLSDSLLQFDQTSYQVNRMLTEEAGFFLWNVSVVDEFGNRARSREARFRVTNGN